MDSLLASRLNNLNDQNDKLRQAEGEYLLKEAKRKTMEADILLTTMASNVAERQAKVHINEDYIVFMKELADLETKFNFEKRRYEILTNAFYSEHSTYKREMSLINNEGMR